MGQSSAGCGGCQSLCGTKSHVFGASGDELIPFRSLPSHASEEQNRPELDEFFDFAGESDSTVPFVPEWLEALAPNLPREQVVRAAAAWQRCAEDLRRRTQHFLSRAAQGVPCRVIEEGTGKASPAQYMLDEGAEVLTIEDLGGRLRRRRDVSLAQVRNIWVCADSELARRAHGDVRPGAGALPSADLACLVLIDGASAPIALVMRSSEAREEFLDCMAVLIAARRLRSDSAMSGDDQAPGWLPAHEAPGLRPLGRSLRSSHLSGPICAWLAHCAPGEGSLPGSFVSLSTAGDSGRVSRTPAGCNSLSMPAPALPNAKTSEHRSSTKGFKASAKNRPRSASADRDRAADLAVDDRSSDKMIALSL